MPIANGPIGADLLRYTVLPVASTTVALSSGFEIKPGTPAITTDNKTAVHAYVPSTYGVVAARFDLSATFETVVNASGKYTSLVTPVAGSEFWAVIFASAL